MTTCCVWASVVRDICIYIHRYIWMDKRYIGKNGHGGVNHNYNRNIYEYEYEWCLLFKVYAELLYTINRYRT